ncbi:MAG TPA: hypothetical protein VMS77_03825 [Conexivisphaerales archaeon]|nr:hypothetical protein [Conexivisphaerales archaeon]
MTSAEPSLEMPKVKRPKRNYKVIWASFALFSVLLFGASFALPFLTGLRTEHIPSGASIAVQPWMSLVPAEAETATFANISNALASGLNASSDVPLLHVYQTGQALTFANITYLLNYNVANSNPNQNDTGVVIIKTTQQAYDDLHSALNASSIVGRVNYRTYTIYFVLNNDSLSKTLLTGRICFLNGLIFYSQSDLNPTSELEAGMDAALDQQTSLFQNRTVQLSVFAVAGSGANYLALNYQGFEGEIKGSDFAAKAVTGSGQSFQAVYAFGFNSTSSASSRAKEVTTVYQGGSDYYLLDNYVVAKMGIDVAGLLIQLVSF